MKLAMITNDTTFAYNLRREILADWIKNGHEVYLISQILNFKNEFEEMGVKLYNVNTGRRGTNPFSDVLLFKEYLRILKEIRPDFVFTNNIKPNVYAGIACKKLKIKYVPNITGLGQAVENPSMLQMLTTRLYKIGVSGADYIFFQNTENLKFFKNRDMLPPNATLRLLPGSGVNLDSHPVLPYPDSDEIHFLFIARILQEKGIDQYLAAAKELAKTHNNLVFHICGMCDDEKYISVLQDYQEKGLIVYHGEQKDMEPFFEQASCVVHPSYYPEGMSNVLLEAASSGRPILAADRSGCRETVENNVTGFLVPTKDSQAVIDSLNKFLEMSWEERKAMGLKGREKMEKEFDRKIVIDEYNKIISSDEKEYATQR